jgi:hypothetical protein
MDPCTSVSQAGVPGSPAAPSFNAGDWRGPGGAFSGANFAWEMIRNAAYLRAEARGFAPGKQIEDWTAAEQDVHELILRRYGG